jgi:3-oxoacyl-[acyl-carrier-protein] synthase II
MSAVKRRVVITGLGLVCSQGEQPDKVFKSWCEGQSGIAVHTVGDEPHSITLALAISSSFNAETSLGRGKLTLMDRVSQLSTVAAASAWQDAGLDDLDDESRESVGILWGTSGGGLQTTEKGYRSLFLKGRSRVSPLSVILGMCSAAASHIALKLRLGGDCLTYSIACASSAVAIGEAFRRIQTGQAEMMVAGGGEAMMPYGLLKAWDSMQVMAPAGQNPEGSCRPFHADRQGLVIAEGAASLVLEDYEHAKKRGANIYAELIGYGSSCDHFHLTAPNPDGQLRALKKVVNDAQLNVSDIGFVNAHGTATIGGDPVEISALRTFLGAHAPKTMINATKSMHGHLLGAAGAIEILATVLSLRNNVVLPTVNLDHVDPLCQGLDHVTTAREGLGVKVALSNSFAFGGSNAVLAMKAI